MKTIATEKLTFAHLQKLDRYTYFATAFTILFVSFSLFWMLFRLDGQEGTILFADAAYAFASLVGALWAGQTAYMGRRGPIRLEPHHQLGWLLVSIGLFAGGLGGAYYTYLEHIHIEPFPSYSDVGFTFFYPLVFIGLLLMPTALRFRIRMGLDALITTLCFFGVSWFFVIGPVYFANVKQATSLPEVLKLVVGLSYPFWDIVLILAVALLIQRRVQPILHSSFILFAVGLLAMIWADTGYAYTNIFTYTYQTGTPWIDTFWFVGFLLMGLAALYQYAALARRAYNEQVQAQSGLPVSPSVSLTDSREVSGGAWRRLRSLLIYIPLTFVLVLTIYGEANYDETKRAQYLVILSAVVSILIAARYLLATHENEVMAQEREREHREAEHLRRLNIQLTGILELEPLLEHIAEMAISELGFDAALLILIEEPHRQLGSQSHLLVNASSVLTPKTKWRLQGDTFFYYLVLAEKAVEVRWDTLSHDVPPEIHAWQQEHSIATMQFLPLIYQGNLLGSLGLARRTSRTLNQHDMILAKAYTEQVVTTIEHAFLYKEARDHEAFARAMASIAARLNSAVVEPAEIQQLICTEGANALQADYAILYEAGDQGQLVSLASYDATSEVSSPSTEWPPIQAHDSEAQAFYSLQPVLFSLKPNNSQPSNTLMRSGNGDLHERDSGSYSVNARMREHHRHSAPSLHDKLMRHNVHTAILAPLIAGGDPVGMLVLGRSVPLSTRDKQSFGSESLPLAQDFAEQASVAFTNAHLYQHLRSTHQRLQELDQLKDQFMVTASHELRTPLTAVQGYIELLGQYDDILPTDQRREFLRKARRSCEELVVLLSNVMDASRLEVEAGIRPALVERVDVWEMVESVINIIEPQVKQEQRQIQVRIPARTSVLADPVRLRQVLMNISVNALKYSPARTPILFSAHVMNTRVPSVTISITDRGKSIGIQDQARLFQRFVRLESDVNSPVRGSGLGLYISRRLTEAMGGKIWIESSGVAGEGSTFHIQLPLA